MHDFKDADSLQELVANPFPNLIQLYLGQMHRGGLTDFADGKNKRNKLMEI